MNGCPFLHPDPHLTSHRGKIPNSFGGAKYRPAALGCRNRGGQEGREGGRERDRGREHLSRLQHVLRAHSQPDATIYSEIEEEKTECQKEKKT